MQPLSLRPPDRSMLPDLFGYRKATGRSSHGTQPIVEAILHAAATVRYKLIYSYARAVDKYVQNRFVTVLASRHFAKSATSSYASTKKCSCYVSGDPHYYTYDGQVIHFMGTCKYILSTNKPGSNLTYFSVEVKNEHRGNTRVSYTRMVDLQLKGVTVRLLPRNKILVNSIKVNLPIDDYLGFSAYYSAGTITVTTKWGLFLRFDGNHWVHLNLPGRFANELIGICGDCNGIKDDFKTKAGEDVSNRKNKYTIIGDSYQVCDDSDKPEKCESQQPENNCSPTQVKSCNILSNSLFKPCVDKIGQNKLNRHLESCKFDVCAYLKQPKLQSVLCKTLESMSDECEDAGVFIDWRKTAKCEKECPLNQEYSHKTPVCQPTCVNQTPKCTKYTEGCICKSGFILSGEECVPKSECGCMNDKIYMTINEERYGPKCNSISTCNGTGHLIHKEINGCPDNSKCKISRNKEGCYCNPGYSLHNGECTQFVCDKPVDVVFLVQASAIGETQFDELKTFATDFTESFTLSLYSARMSLHTFTVHRFSFGVRNSDDPLHVQKAAKTLQYVNESTSSLYNIFYYLNKYKQTILNLRHPIKDHSAVVLFVGSNLIHETQSKNMIKTLNKAGFNIYIVAIGENANEKQLRNIIGQTNTSNLMFAKNFYELNNIKLQILKKACSVDPCKNKINPCKNGGKCINKDSTFICECTENYFGRFCAQEKKCSCYNYGLFYYQTFDGQAISFKGDCKYNMVSGKSGNTKFSVDVESERRNLVDPYYTTKRLVDVKINSITIRLLPLNRIWVNEEEFTLPVVKYEEFEAYYAVGWITVTTKWGLIVRYDGNHRITVSLPISFANKLTGICGDCNGEQDDFRTKSGRNVSSLENKDSLIADSYQVTGDSNEKCNATSVVNIKCNSTEVQRCNIIHSNIFTSCVQTLGQKLANRFFESCQSDVCSSSVSLNTDILICKSIEAFVTECERAGVPINWRGIAECPSFCAGYESYKYYATSCRNDCLNTTKCSTFSEGCTCGQNFRYSGKRCMPKNYGCGCSINDEYFMRGTYLVDSTCNNTYYCSANGKYKKYSYFCSKNGKCDFKNGKRQCVCKNGYYGSGCQHAIGRWGHFIQVWNAELKAVPWASYSVDYSHCSQLCYFNKFCKAFSSDHTRRICNIYNVDASGNFTLAFADCSSKYYYQRSSKHVVINGASLHHCEDTQTILNVKNPEDCQETCSRKGCFGTMFLKSKKVCKMVMSLKYYFRFIGNEDSYFAGMYFVFPVNKHSCEWQCG
ncbi:zonadhesin-like [Octopus bimaculoides]|uniref:zonadhesin-like n=1 Tax=Octopus bimaculoides TaxID=37653 RepID=UPI0022E2FF4D|nr:zonadhesin-like [Octopus bimaculoides]